MAAENKKPTRKYDINRDPYLGPIYRVGKSILTLLTLPFILPTLIIILCVYLKTAGRVILSILMGIIGFLLGVLWVDLLLASRISSYSEVQIAYLSIGIVLAAIFGIIGWKFGWEKAAPLLEMSYTGALKRVGIKMLIMVGIFLLISVIVGIFPMENGAAIPGIGSIVPVIYWLITLIRPNKKTKAEEIADQIRE
jgi:hypothetical protein